jgi:hypothetical protein
MINLVTDIPTIIERVRLRQQRVRTVTEHVDEQQFGSQGYPTVWFSYPIFSLTQE